MSQILVSNLEPDRYSLDAVALLQTKFLYFPDAHPDAEVLIVRLAKKIDTSVLSQFPRLKWVVTATTGLDHLDLETMKQRNIGFLSLKGETAFLETIPSTAELSWGLLLAMMRHIPSAMASVDHGVWNRDLFRGHQLRGKSLGIIGLGRIGSMMARYGQAFGMQVRYVDPQVVNPDYKQYDSLEELVETSDVICLHVPYDATTKGMISRELIAKFKPAAWFLNTSRGGLVDEFALSDALRSGKLKAVGTDVLATELEDYKKSPLFLARAEGLPVLITPHIGGASLDAMHACEVFMAEKLLRQYFG